MADKPVKLTDRGKHTLIVVVTVTGCILGILFSFVLSVLHGPYQKDSFVLADETKREKTAETQHRTGTEKNLSPGWLYYMSAAGKPCSDEMKQYFDILINQWTKGKLTDDELGEQMTVYLEKRNLPVSTAGIQSKSLCLFPSADDLPDYTKMRNMGENIYDFIGVYTEGQYDEEGRLLCYYWEAGVR